MKDLRDNRRLSESSIQYTDAELIEMLEAEGYKVTYKNLQILKEGLADGSIVIDEASSTSSTGTTTTIDPTTGTTVVVAKPKTERAAKTTTSSFTLPPVKPEKPTENIDKDKKKQSDDEQKDKNVAKAVESDADVVAKARAAAVAPFTRTFREDATIKLIDSFLTEDCGGDIRFTTLTEEVKSEGIKQIAIALLKNIEEKLTNIDTTSADRSKGDIKQLKELESIQDTINILEELIERNTDAPAEYSKAVNIVIKSLLYINQYSNVFKDAYRNKKTLMMMKYQSLILSVIASVSYLVSVLVLFKKDSIDLNTSVSDIIAFSPLKGLEAFNKSVESGEFKVVAKDVEVLREYFLEYNVDTMSSILEAVEYGPMIIEGIKNIYNNLINGNAKLTNLIYRAAGIFVLLLSIRDVLYTLFKMRTRVSEMIENIGIFSNIRTLGANVLAKLGLYSDKFKADAEMGSTISKREIEDENKKLLLDVKQIQSEKAIKPEPEVIDAVISEPKREVENKPRTITVKPTNLVKTTPAAPKPADNPFGFDF